MKKTFIVPVRASTVAVDGVGPDVDPEVLGSCISVTLTNSSYCVIYKANHTKQQTAPYVLLCPLKTEQSTVHSCVLLYNRQKYHKLFTQNYLQVQQLSYLTHPMRPVSCRKCHLKDAANDMPAPTSPQPL